MILAYKTGMLVGCSLQSETPKHWKVKEMHSTTIFTVKKDETRRKLFDGPTAVDDAMNWIAEDNS